MDESTGSPMRTEDDEDFGWKRTRPGGVSYYLLDGGDEEVEDIEGRIHTVPAGRHGADILWYKRTS